MRPLVFGFVLIGLAPSARPYFSWMGLGLDFVTVALVGHLLAWHLVDWRTLNPTCPAEAG